MTSACERRILQLLLAVAVAIALCVLGGCSSASSGSSDTEASDDDLKLEINDTGTKGSLKLVGATETIDDDGIVHGVTRDGIAYTVVGRGTTSIDPSKVTLCAAGDAIGSDNARNIADRAAGSFGDGEYDFSVFYEDVCDFIRSYDLRYVNQETVMGGADRGFTGYPVFNTPDEAVDALDYAGFNLVSFATNHSYDMGTSGIERSHEVFAQYPDMLIGGSYLTEEDRETVHMIERNGINFAFLSYTYGDNFYDVYDVPVSYYSCQFIKDDVEEDVRRAQEVADVVIVSVHWGTEYVADVDDQQWDYAQFLADLDVDVVVGEHAHVLQTVKYVTSESGKVVPVAFGLSDFASGWTITDTILSGLFTCDFINHGSGNIEVTNVTFYPAIEWANGGDPSIRLLKDMSVDELNSNTRTPDVGDDWSHIQSYIDNLGMDVPVVM